MPTTQSPMARNASSAEEVTHSFRPSLFSRERRYVVGSASLKWSDGTREEEVPLSAIRRMHIYHAPASGGRTIRRTIIRLQDGRKLVVQSNHFVRLGSFDDRLVSYTTFLRTLLDRLQAAHASVEVLIGTPTGLWMTYLVLLITAGGVLAAGLILWIVGSFPFSTAVTFALLAGFLPLCWRVVRGGRAHPVDLAAARDALPD